MIQFNRLNIRSGYITFYEYIFKNLDDMFQFAKYSPKKIFTFTSLSLAGGGGYYIYNDEGKSRSAKFWINILPMYMTYRYVELLNSDLKVISDEYAMKWYDTLHDKFADRVKVLTYEFKGFYLKQAQLLSTQDDFVPPQYMKWVKNTQDRVPSEFSGSQAKEYVAKLCEEELGMKFEDIFESWDDEPLGVASIGEVHKAVLKHNKQVVAVKFQNPGIEKKFRDDVITLKAFTKFAMPQHYSSFNETEKIFGSEFDYIKEAQNLYSAYTITLPKWKHRIYIPMPYLEYCSKNILVMEYLEGIKLVDGIRAQYARLAALQGKTLEDLEAERKQQIASGQFKFKSIREEKWENYRTNVYVTTNDILKVNLWIGLENVFNPIRWVYGLKPFQWTEIPIDLGDTIEFLCQFQACNIFDDGVFNGDAHPGNILLLKDGRLGLIDYGQVKHMPLEHRIKYAKLILALSRQDKNEVVRLYFDELGTKTKYRNEEIAYLLASFYHDRSTDDVLGNHNISTFIDYCQSKDPMIQVAEDYLFASRANVLLRGVGKAFGIQLHISQIWKHKAEEFLKSHNIEY